MQREVWALNEAWVTVWREVNGSPTGDALLEAEYIRNLSLSERPNFVRKQQPDVAFDSRVVNGVQITFRMAKGYLSKSVTDGITNPSYEYRINIALVNPLYAGDPAQSDDTHVLHTCVLAQKDTGAQDNDVFEEELVYDVGQAA